VHELFEWKKRGRRRIRRRRRRRTRRMRMRERKRKGEIQAFFVAEKTGGKNVVV